MKKKIISSILCMALSAVSVISSSAISADNTVTSEAGNSLNYQTLGTTTLKNNYATFYTYGTDIDPTSGISLYIGETSQADFEYYFNKETPNGVSKNLPNPDGYRLYTCLSSGSINCRRILNFNNGGGTYEKVRIKLSAFSSYFNADGTRTKSFGDDTHDYNFTKESNGIYSSSLIFFSGNAITAAAPDENGMVEIYVSTKLGEYTIFTTDFRKKTPTGSSSGGGTVGLELRTLLIGDVDKSNLISLSDGIAALKASTKIQTLDELSARNADTNRDGNITLIDAIAIQKYSLNNW